eukprot:m.140479 g.140479  ORF g.140479 m.140479 type:complete len:210 (+) comp14826_c1_seq12:1236-1865(+)
MLISVDVKEFMVIFIRHGLENYSKTLAFLKQLEYFSGMRLSRLKTVIVQCVQISDFGIYLNNFWFRGALMRASWTQGRFWGIVPAAGRDIPGVIVTKGYDTNTSSGKRLFANLNATRGYIVAEVLYDTTSKLRTSLSSEHGVELANLVPVPGYSLSDCDNITKVDNPSRMVTWGNGKHTTLPTLTTNQGKVIAIRFVIKEAVLYGFQFL